jgi:putative ABC transport system permease protein
MNKRERQLSNLKIAVEALLANKVRSMLTALGIIFGVSAVIAMLAIGNGARQEILEQIRLVGVNNVVITSVFEQDQGDLTAAEQQQPNRFSRGLHLSDAEAILEVLPSVTAVSPEVVYETEIIREGFKRSSRVVGVTPAYFDISNLLLAEGQGFTEEQLAKGQAVCIIGATIAKRFFNKEPALGNYIKVGNHWLKVVGVLQETAVSEKAIENLGIRDFNSDVYAPIKTVLSRYINRASVQQAGGGEDVIFVNGGMVSFDGEEEGEGKKKKKNYHQLDRLVVQVGETEAVKATTDVLLRMLSRRHNEVVDFEISIPEQLLKQQQRTKDIFNLVLGAIAGISLLVGGIGIMNIMLASVLERTREIGTRRALGAQKSDIIMQFMFEAVLISLGGGAIGVVLGVLMAVLIGAFTDIQTIVSPFSVFLSFGVSATVGLIFGITPARRAAEQNPIESLRYE